MTTVNISSVESKVVVTENGSTTVVTVPQTSVVTAITQGPQGATGEVAGGLPTGGDPGNILIKDTNANYDTSWTATLDGGTFN
jgi:hypothetical protein